MTDQSPCTASPEWYTPVWTLDSWTYETKLQNTAEGVMILGDDFSRVRRTRRNDTSMVLLAEGAAIAALCGDPGAVGEAEEEQEDAPSSRRDVALAVAMFKMVAFQPFCGIRAGSDSTRRNEQVLICDHADKIELTEDGDLACESRSEFRTPLKTAYSIGIRSFELAAKFPQDTIVESALLAPCIKSCGTTGNIALLHHIATQIKELRLIVNREQKIIWYVSGAAMADNATSIDLLIRFPPPEWKEDIANCFHLSLAATNPRFLDFGSPRASSLNSLTSTICHTLPANNDDTLWEQEFRKLQKVGGGRSNELEGEEDENVEELPLMPTTNPSKLHARLVSNVMTKKNYGPNLGHMAFPNSDLIYAIATLIDRIDRGRSITLDSGVFSSADLARICVELQPNSSDAWHKLCYFMRKSGHMEVDLGAAHAGRTPITKVDAAVKALELEIDEKDPRNDESAGWNNLASYLAPGSSVQVKGTTYTRFQCASKALEWAFDKRSFYHSLYAWEALSFILEPSEPGAPPTPSTHFGPTVHHVAGLARTDRTYNSMECMLVALGAEPKLLPWYWVHLGRLVWRYAKQFPLAHESSVSGDPTVTLPFNIVKPIESTVRKVLTAGGKTLENVKETLSDPVQDVIGAGGDSNAVGACDAFIRLTELECYLIAHNLNEITVLREIGWDDEPEVMHRFVEVLTPDRISERGRRVVESLLEGGGSFEKQYSN